ncbi:MAG: hypothetical protein EA402_07730 [Planctomycetota bacterium]|nr:MAG: hypothetical protein EA402_07730 [Planctomycetota bacterium]
MLFDRSGATYVGNLGPVPLFVHPSALFLLVLVYLLFQPQDPITFVILVTVLVLAIVLHEMGHGLMARFLGAQGVTITLMAMGGLCSSYRERDRHFGEMLILAAGPAVSFALWGLSLGAMYLLGEHAPHRLIDNGVPTLLMQFLFYNAWINFWLGVFNSLPIYPLDGGQFLFHLMRLCRVRWQATHLISFYLSLVFVALVLSWRLWVGGGQIDAGFMWVAFLLGYLLYNAHVYLMQR